jgi:hypothetical protein
MLTKCGPSDNEEAVFGKAVDGEVTFDAAAFVEALGVNEIADGHINLVGADVVEEASAPGPRTSNLLNDVSSKRPAFSRVIRCS